MPAAGKQVHRALAAAASQCVEGCPVAKPQSTRLTDVACGRQRRRAGGGERAAAGSVLDAALPGLIARWSYHELLGSSGREEGPTRGGLEPWRHLRGAYTGAAST